MPVNDPRTFVAMIACTASDSLNDLYYGDANAWKTFSTRTGIPLDVLSNPEDREIMSIGRQPIKALRASFCPDPPCEALEDFVIQSMAAAVASEASASNRKKPKPKPPKKKTPKKPAKKKAVKKKASKKKR